MYSRLSALAAPMRWMYERCVEAPWALRLEVPVRTGWSALLEDLWPPTGIAERVQPAQALYNSQTSVGEHSPLRGCG